MWWESPSSVSINTDRHFFIDGAQYDPNLQTVHVIQDSQLREKQIILPTTRCKNNESPPQ